jgi:hypothetical protein
MDADKEDIRAFQEKFYDFYKKMMAMLDAHHERTVACFGQTEATDFSVNPEKTEPNPEENEAVLERQRVHDEEPASGNIKDDKNETTTCNEAKEKIEKNPEMMQSTEEYQDVRSKDVAVMPAKGLKKRRKGRKLIAERRGEPKKLNRGHCGSRKKLAAACRKMSRHAAVVWHKRNLIRRSETRGYCGSRKGVTVADRRTCPHATVAWKKRKLTRNIQLRENHESSKDVAVNGMRKGPGYKHGTRRRDVKKLPNLKKGRTMNGFKGWSTGQRSYMGKGRTLRMNLYETFGGQIAKQVVGTSCRLRRMRIWTLWRGKPPPKRKKELQVERQPVM